MKRSTLITVIFLLLLVGGWYYVHNYTKLLSKDNTYYTYYDNVAGLQAAAPVYLQGVKVGRVKDIDLNHEQNIRVIFSIRKDIQLTQGTVALIGAGDLTGNKAVNLIPGPSTAIIAPDGFLTPGRDSTMIENFNAKITPIIHNGKTLLKTTDEGLAAFNKILIRGWGIKTQEDIRHIADRSANFARASGNANQGVQRLQDMINRLDSATSDPDKTIANTNESLNSSEKKTAEMAKRPTKQQVEDLNASIKKISDNLAKLSQNKMLSDRQGYVDAANSLDTLNRSMIEYKNDPPSPIKIFSSKKKK
jgi:phospholipid/cholesterol/gamma-HCH transport system substrate-binding protein